MNLFKHFIGMTLTSVLADSAANGDTDAAPTTVQDLIAAYGWNTDQRDIDGLLELFEQEAVLESPKTNTTVRGREAIAALITTAWAQVPAEDKRRHLIAGVRAFGKQGKCVEFHATFALVGTPAEGAPAVYVTGCYQGIACLSDTGPRFRRLTVAMD